MTGLPGELIYVMIPYPIKFMFLSPFHKKVAECFAFA